jgi:hypothetical protein
MEVLCAAADLGTMALTAAVYTRKLQLFGESLLMAQDDTIEVWLPGLLHGGCRC